MPAFVPGFGGGVVLEGSADTQRTDELSACDAYDIGPRGALICARDVADYVTINDRGTVPAPWSKLHAVRGIAGNNYVKEIAVGEGLVVADLRYLLAAFLRSGAVSPITGATDIQAFGVVAPRSEGVLVTVAAFPGIYPITGPGANINVFLINIGAREGFAANVAPGLYVAYATPSGSDLLVAPISTFDAMGTGPRGEFATGASSTQLYFRGIAAFNGYGMGWGFDSNGGTDKEGPARLMFSNIANPLKWGNDNKAGAGANRAFTDSDAIPIGDGGEAIRAGLQWAGRFYVGTDRGLHYLGGYGRDSFTTDGANPIAKAENVLGPACLIEGPDKLLYGMGENGLWGYDGASFAQHHRRLLDYESASTGWWDLIWTDRLRADTYPGKTNADLVWMVADWDTDHVVVGIPWCDASAGSGYGTDTVLIKFNVRTGGFTRQVFAGVQFTAADYGRRQRQYPSSRFLGTATAGTRTIRKYGDKTATSGQIADPLPSVEVGPYALFGPDGVGTYRKAFLTLSWAANEVAVGDWTLRTSAADNNWRSICWAPALSLFCAVANSGVGTRVMTSPDGSHWTTRASASDINWRSVCWAAALSRFVAVADNGVGTGVMTSPDGLVWTSHAPATDDEWATVCYSAELALFVAVGNGDGVGTGTRVMTSADGVTWTARTAAAANDWTSVCWAPGLALFVAVASINIGTAANRIMTSPDGVTWTSRTAASDVSLTSVCWSSDLNLLCAVAVAESVAGSGDTIMTSPDGISWTGQVRPADHTWQSVCWASEIGKFIAVASTGTGDRAMGSSDGATWLLQASAADNNWSAVCWSPDLRMLAAVSSSGASNRVMTASSTSPTPDLSFNIQAKVDGYVVDTVKLSIRDTAPAAPANGDVWLDLSGTDTSLGNASAGSFIGAAADYLVKIRNAGAWVGSGSGGQKGQRAMIPIAFTPRQGTHLSLIIDTITADRRYQLEGVGYRGPGGA